jgi:O-antigen/teichoic acid export membrane protein
VSTTLDYAPPTGGDLRVAAPETGQPGHEAGRTGGPRLPLTWPLAVAFVGFPIWWVLGISAFIWPIVAVPMTMALLWRRWARAPVVIFLWFAFTSWVLLSGLQLTSITKIMTFSYRLALYAGAGIIFLYVYNLPRFRGLDTKVLRILTIFWMIVVAGGYAGILLRAHTFTPPIDHLLPKGLRSQPFVQELVQPVFAEIQPFLGHSHPRPAAPFAYTNNWGGNIAVLTPVAIAAAIAAGRGLRRRLIIAVLAASLVPMIFSLNRGMFLSLAVAIAYVALRLAVRGRLGSLVSVIALTALLAIVVVMTPLGHLVTGSFSSTHGHSNATRLSLYQQAAAGTNASPVFGHGEPQPVTGSVLSGTPAIGTQGQLWMVLYSNGYPAALFFIAFFVGVLWQTRRARGAVGLLLHTVSLVALVQIPVYGWLPDELQVVMVVAALAYRCCWRPEHAPASSAAQGLTEPPLRRPRSRPDFSRAPITFGNWRTVSGPSAEVASVARGSAINLTAMVLGAVLSFGLTVLVSRWLGPRSAGGFFELISLFTILSYTLYLGADTGLLRWIARARAMGGLADTRKIVRIAVVPVFLVGCAAAAAVWIAAPEIARVFLHGMAPTAAVTDIRFIAPLVPLGALCAVILSGARGFGRTWPYLAITGLGQPAVRIGLVLVALVMGWGLRGALVGWGVPVALGAAAAWFILARLIKAEVPADARAARPSRSAGSRRRPTGLRVTGSLPAIRSRQRARDRGQHRAVPGSETARGERLGVEFWRFAAPRGFAGAFQIVVIWLDILLVGAVLSSYAAGVYAAVSKLALVGTFALEATRLAIGPQLSPLMARHEFNRAADLHQSATRWLVIASWPMYIMLAIFPVVVLGIFGHRYTVGAAALVVISLAMLVNLGTGNVTVVLLMGGKSSLSAYNALSALVVNVGLNLILLPRIGIVGAAIAWAASIVVENVAAAIEVWLMFKIGAFGKGYWLVAAASVGCFAVPGLAARALLGQTLPALALATIVGLAVFAAVLYAARVRLQLADLMGSLRAGRAW